VEAAGAVLAAGAIAWVAAFAAWVAAAGAAVVDAAGAAAFSGLLQAAMPRAKAAADRTTTYLFMIVYHRFLCGKKEYAHDTPRRFESKSRDRAQILYSHHNLWRPRLDLFIFFL
jgi:lysophospholipase L1-like esterase